MKQWRQALLTGLVVVLTSQMYWNLFADNFRISLSVAVFPVMLLLNQKRVVLPAAMCTGAAVFVFRFCLSLWDGISAAESTLSVLPGALFYICYGALFTLFNHKHYTSSFQSLFIRILLCDFASNLFELLLRAELHLPGLGTRCVSLVEIAAIRACLALLMLAIVGGYRSLLARVEHENRYQRLFLMTTSLKSEIYFMRKNSEEIEAIMGNAYKLYEQCTDLDLPEDTRKLALAIARDVHEIKKDYVRIIQGIENEIREQYDEAKMSFQDLLRILSDTTYRMLEERQLDIHLEFHCAQDFVTPEHYSLMVVLKNLVNNAVEAIESKGRSGLIQLWEDKSGEDYVIRVIDNGPGIHQKTLPRIFQMGFSTKYDGKTGNLYRGVGLSGVRIVVEEQFHGTIDVTTTPGVSTEFRVEIPANVLEGT